MIKFKYKCFTLAHMPRECATIEQVKVCRQFIADTFNLNVYDVIIKNSLANR